MLIINWNKLVKHLLMDISLMLTNPFRGKLTTCFALN